MSKSKTKRKRTKIEKGLIALLATPDVLAITAIVVSGLIYLFLK